MGGHVAWACYEGGGAMRGFVSVALRAELVESSGRVVRREWGRG